eukprot:TRINITY_DN1974_c0_g1_i2.p1 TRINITY_DN1974_c0_g1~~TRINITY_DN1974_c0_g1_i2.p1  ORF type:complete len:458 (-),score=48.99 TRINITY_DN1974_c0_g1_i2:185-1558(-)
MSWTRYHCACAPEARGGHSAVVLGTSHVVVFGGNADPRRQTLLADQSGNRRGCILRDCKVLDVNTMTWSTIESIGQSPSARYAHAACSLGDNRMVIHGGHDGEKWLDDLVVLELTGAQGMPHWTYPTTSGQTPGPRHGHTLTEVGSKLFLFGGYCNDNYYNDIFVLEYESDRPRWSRLVASGTPPTPRAYHTATLIDKNYLMIFGGRGSDGSYIQDVAALDLSAMRWFYPKFFNSPPSGRAHHSATLYGTKLYIIGGQNSQSTFLNDVHVLHNGKWQAVTFNGTPMSPRSRHTTTLVNGNTLVIFGGYDGGSWMNDAITIDMEYAQQQTDTLRLRDRIEFLEGKKVDRMTIAELEELEEIYFKGLYNISRAKSDAIRREYEQKISRNAEQTRPGSAAPPLSPLHSKTPKLDYDQMVNSSHFNSNGQVGTQMTMSAQTSHQGPDDSRRPEGRVRLDFS